MGYGLVLIGVVITLVAQSFVTSRYRRYRTKDTKKGLSGQEVARMILDKHGLSHIYVTEVKGTLTDHYDPRKRVLRLSQSVYGVDSVAAVSVACHEAGHAIQHAVSYAPLKIRNSIVPVVNVASRFSWLLIFIGIGLLYAGNYIGDMIFNIGVIAFVAVIIFHAVTLPVEFDASRRALKQMEAQGIIIDDEDSGARKVLGAAAMTYVASLAMAVANLLRILALRGRD